MPYLNTDLRIIFIGILVLILPVVYVVYTMYGLEAQRVVSPGKFRFDYEKEVGTEEKDFIAIPSIGMKVDLYFGKDEQLLEKGAWLKRSGVEPDQVGNVVVSGHRYTSFFGKKPFFHLNKLRKGESIFINWQGKYYEYSVAEIFKVNSDEIWIEDQNFDGLTVYTCDGINSSKRLVLRAKLAK